MITIPAIRPNYGPWHIFCSGKISKLIKNVVIEVIKTVLVHQKIKKKDLIVEVQFKSKTEMAIANKKYLNKEGSTDTISLPIDNCFEAERINLVGYITLCFPVIQEKARLLNKNEMHHLTHIVVHSVLHLLGYDHEDDEDAKSMEAKEAVILAKLGVQWI